MRGCVPLSFWNQIFEFDSLISRTIVAFCCYELNCSEEQSLGRQPNYFVLWSSFLFFINSFRTFLLSLTFLG
uniref:Uncharacterized protein n=1 Tax=Rhizophora mucronata TaxID=61149 RepID=A0A2P2IMA5_RHIMU